MSGLLNPTLGNDMKLIDLRTVKQVHKGTVAAGKAPRLELGVLGISIGQKQSTGDTSRPALPWGSKPRMPLGESTGGKHELFTDLLHMFDLGSPTVYRADYDRDAVLDDAINIMRAHAADDQSTHGLWHVLHDVARGSNDIGRVGDIISLASQLRQFGITLSKEQQEFVDNIVSNADRFSDLRDHVKAVGEYLQYLEFLRNKMVRAGPDTPIIEAAFKKLGIL